MKKQSSKIFFGGKTYVAEWESEAELQHLILGIQKYFKDSIRAKFQIGEYILPSRKRLDIATDLRSISEIMPPPTRRHIPDFFHRNKLVSADIVLLKKDRLDTKSLIKDILGSHNSESYISEYIKTSPLKIKNLTVTFVQNSIDPDAEKLILFLHNNSNRLFDNTKVDFSILSVGEYINLAIRTKIDPIVTKNYIITLLTEVNNEAPIV